MRAPTGWIVLPDDRGARAVLSWGRWILAGRPRRLPVVTRQGAIEVCPHGHILFRDWSLDFARATVQPGAGAELVDGLSRKYGYTMVDSVPDCLDCKWEAQA